MKYSNLTLTAAAVTAALAVGTTAQAQDADTVTTENVKVTASRVEQELMDAICRSPSSRPKILRSQTHEP